MPVIYLDVLIVLNWLIDSLLLLATARLLRIPHRRFRTMLGALFGGVYACRIVFPTLPFIIRLLADVAAASVMLLIAFGRCGVYTFVKRVVLFLIASLLLTGVATWLSVVMGSEQLLVHNGEVYVDVSPLLLTIFTVITYGAVRLWEWAVTRRLPKGGECRLTIKDDGGERRIRAMWDSGLHVREPFSGVPVVVAERRSVEVCLPDGWRENSTTTRLRMIPYRTVGGDGLLPAFRPRSVILHRLGERSRDITGVYVALCDDLGRGEYEALIGNDCWEGWER